MIATESTARSSDTQHTEPVRPAIDRFARVDGRWQRSLRAPDSQVELLVRGQKLQGRARVIFDDADYTRHIFDRLRPDVPAWLPDWLNAKLIVIETTQ